MNVETHLGPLAGLDADVLIIPLKPGATPPADVLAALGEASAARVRAVIDAGDFAGKADSAVVVHLPGAPVPRVVLSGMGQAKRPTDALRRAVGHGIRSLRGLAVKRAAVLVDPGTEESAQVCAEGALIATYEMLDYRTVEKGDRPILDQLTFVAGSDVLAGVERGRILAAAAARTRDLVMHPSNVLTPTRFEAEARDLAASHGLAVEVLGLPELEAQGFGGLLAVGRASNATEPPRLIKLTWAGNPAEDPIVLVGKGVTFDTGGISIKPAPGMELMKFDMGGAAGVFGAMQAVAALKLPRHVVALLPVTENMPGGDAFKPGDVLVHYGGQTSEIINTDAEGRLILADALAYAVATLKPQALIDVATLTGGCVMTFGDITTGLMTNDQALADHVLASSQRAGEHTWQLPMFDEYDALLKSEIADMRNSVGRPAGTIAAACYLQRFVGDVPWVHLDIAGTVWADREMPHLGKGPTGAPVRTLVEVLEAWPAG